MEQGVDTSPLLAPLSSINALSVYSECGANQLPVLLVSHKSPLIAALNDTRDGKKSSIHGQEEPLPLKQ